MNRIYQTNDGRVPGIEYVPCGAITPKVGMMLKLSGGSLAMAAGADQPGYFSMAERETACTAGELIPVIHIETDMVFETETPASFSAVAGGKVKLSADGMTVAAASGGACEVAYTDEEVTRYRIVPVSA